MSTLSICISQDEMKVIVTWTNLWFLYNLVIEVGQSPRYPTKPICYRGFCGVLTLLYLSFIFITKQRRKRLLEYMLPSLCRKESAQSSCCWALCWKTFAHAKLLFAHCWLVCGSFLPIFFGHAGKVITYSLFFPAGVEKQVRIDGEELSSEVLGATRIYQVVLWLVCPYFCRSLKRRKKDFTTVCVHLEYADDVAACCIEISALVKVLFWHSKFLSRLWRFVQVDRLKRSLLYSTLLKARWVCFSVSRVRLRNRPSKIRKTCAIQGMPHAAHWTVDAQATPNNSALIYDSVMCLGA